MINVTTGNGLFDGQFTRLWKDLYIMTSSKEFRKELPYPVEMKQYLDYLYGTFGQEYTFCENKYKIDTSKVHCDEHDDRVVCGFSGGKDSVANALMLKELGYKPTLFFVKGINRSYPQELDYAKRLADRLDMELVIYTIKVSGKCDFFENPTKDQFILATMVDYGLKYNIPNYSFGTYYESELQNMSETYMMSDAAIMFWNALKFYKHFIPEMDIPIFLENECDAWYEICKYDSSLLLDTYSCMTPLRYRDKLIKQAENKYGIKSLPGRCPSCYKCCNEYATFNAFGLIKDYPEDFIKHCEDVCVKFYAKYKDADRIAEIRKLDWVSEFDIDRFMELKDKSTNYELEW